jgi:hypothetical protein
MESITLHVDGAEHVFDGTALGAATSESRYHSHPEDFLAPSTPSAAVSRRQKCSACRWLETKIYKTADGRFVAHTVGRSIVPGEQDYVRVTFTPSAYELVEILTVKGQTEPFIPLPSARALAQAAAKDDDVHDAYINRAVVR